MAGGKQGRGQAEAGLLQGPSPGARPPQLTPGATDLPGHPRHVCGAAGRPTASQVSGLTDSPPPPPSSSVQVHVQLCSTECQLLPWVPGGWWSEATGDWQIPLCPPLPPPPVLLTCRGSGHQRQHVLINLFPSSYDCVKSSSRKKPLIPCHLNLNTIARLCCGDRLCLYINDKV